MAETERKRSAKGFIAAANNEALDAGHSGPNSTRPVNFSQHIATIRLNCPCHQSQKSERLCLGHQSLHHLFCQLEIVNLSSKSRMVKPEAIDSATRQQFQRNIIGFKARSFSRLRGCQFRLPCAAPLCSLDAPVPPHCSL